MEIKEILIKFMEWQLETKPLNANFTHNYVVNKFLEDHPEINKNDINDTSRCECGGFYRYTSINNYYCINCFKTYNNI